MVEAGPRRAPPVAVIGAGWSGLAAAIGLTQGGIAVALIEAAPQFGGRARRVELALGDRHYPLDNGQHLLIGACRQTLALMRSIDIDPDPLFLRLPFSLTYPDGFRLRAPRLPAPLHLAGALATSRGLSWAARLALVGAVRRWQRARWTVDPDTTAAALLADQPAELIDRLWQPLAVAALNARLTDASARMFLAVLRDSLGADRAASDLLLPRADLSSLLPDRARAWLDRQGAALRLRCMVDAIRPAGGHWAITTREGMLGASALVLALPPARAAALLASACLPALDDAVRQLRAIDAAPIATVYLRYAPHVRTNRPLYALREDPALGHFGQWLFDRGALDARCAGVFSVVVSADGPHRVLPHDALAQAVAAQLTRQLRLPPPLAARVLVERRATVVARPGLRRPPVTLPVPGLFLAGDSADSEYPSTIEGSVRSGLAAARALRDSFVRDRRDPRALP